MMKKPILTIAIPTYNGGNFIRETLESIVNQFNSDEVYSNVSIFVSDNASEDNTLDIVNEYMNKYKNIKYYKNEKNLGADINFDLAVRGSDGEFVWILSDDDYIKPNSLIKVLDVITNDESLSSIYVNYSTIDSKTKCYIKEKAININNDIICEDGNAFFKITKFTSSLVSTVIIKKTCWVKVNTKQYYGCSYIHFAVLLESLVDKKSCIISNTLLVERSLQRLEYKDWTKGTKILKVSMNLANLFKNMKKMGYDNNLIKYVCGKMKRQNLKLIIILKAKGVVIDKNILDEMKKTYGCYLSFWLIDMIIMKIPDSLFAFLKSLKILKLKYKKSSCIMRGK